VVSVLERPWSVRLSCPRARSRLNVQLDEHSPAYTKLGTACLHAYLRGLEAIEKRDGGVTVETPKVPQAGANAVSASGTLREALEGWKKHRARPPRTVFEFSRSVDMFIQLLGDIAVMDIRRKHALEFRKALQDVPRFRKGDLLEATLSTQAAWGREHPEAQKITAATINKQLGAVQSVCIWANDCESAHNIDPTLGRSIKDVLCRSAFGSHAE